ncbi:uncharacterized protein AB675_7168 [Cyphellophora attinorum]|uniref:DUF4238 domain-containing protein n=1 Tax=Cyphellophora attinorum TaxID=1664694 RepID=A0A0N1P302_9EURO|nr:uncharacterized protein AB675_7168 [Phialophora attinorum]KPI43225.1 hypothetical protein AB675_7168 [Phialophora attinorum]
MNAPTGSQYQHYVPQFILRKFSDFVRPGRDTYQNRKDFDRAEKKAKKKARVNVFSCSPDFSTWQLEQHSCAKVFGIYDMYEAAGSGSASTPEPDGSQAVGEIEKLLSGLELAASKIIEKIEHAFSQGTGSFTITRPDKDLLRRFIFIMTYRSRKFHQRFSHQQPEYTSNDREQLLEYMRSKGFSSPREVWLEAIRAFIEVDLTQGVLEGVDWLMGRAYPPDVQWLRKNMITTYLCFCTPEDADDEFLLPQNAYGVYEGPTYHENWLDWHTFFPIHHRVMIVLRNRFLGPFPPSSVGGSEARDVAGREIAMTVLTARFPNKTKARSWLEHMPVTRPSPHYRSVPTQDGEVPTILVSGGVSDAIVTSHLVFAEQESTYSFQLHRLPHLFTQRINAIYLEEAIATDTVIYKSANGLRRALEWYLEETPHLKDTVTTTPEQYEHLLHGLDAEMVERLREGIREELEKLPEYRRKPYLQMLEAIARDLGSSCTARYNILPATSGPFMELFARPTASA